MKQYAVVTGASQGLGKAFALELAQRKINTLLVSLPNQNVAQLAEEIRTTYGVDAQHYETDLSVLENVVNLANWINENFEVFVLINNAGIGGTGRFAQADINRINTMLQLNVVATSVLTHQLLPNLFKQPKGYILNVSSIAAFTPVGFKTVYPASKMFIHWFSRGLYQELKKTSVFVSVVNPGAMRTNEDIVKRIEKLGFFGRATLKSPEKIAKRCVTQLFKRDTVIMVNRLTWLISAILPVWIKLPMMTKVIEREIKAAEA